MAIVTNYLLFNHTYLRQLQADSSVDDEASVAAQGVREWYGFQDRTSTEALVQSWVAPMLQILELELQPLSPDQAANDAHVHLLYTAWDHEKETPVGLCYVTPPGADLDTTTKGRHWMAHAILAARNLQSKVENRKSKIRWVILTNGDQWRLLDAQALRRYEAYLQVDLGELARDPSDLSALRLFYRCFHRSAFTPTQSSPSQGEGREEVGLDHLLAESDHATEQAEDHLKARVSHNEGIMARLCLGFVQTTGKTSFTEAERDGIYRDATYLLYRMLFILYAEARGLLPMDNPAYQAVSLTELAQTAYDYRLRGMPNGQATALWDQLKQLCTAIYESDAELNIPAYNGGLFDDADKPHLREGSIADAYLTEALFDLAYRPDANTPDGYQAIDYRDLSVRHLGSLYEGMIEYRLQIAEETLWARRDKKGNVRFLRTCQDGAPRRTDVEIKQGDVYFSQSPGERRATGTYYTPEYIVDYIVRQAVVRGLRERRAPLEEKLSSWLEEITATTDPNERARMQHTADEELLRFVEEQVLTFRACDPAMGSGHFLVNAAHQMTHIIVETLHLTPWENTEIDADPVTWRRRVVERCLYGVDLSLMAVELAKLSLWLASVAEGKPLSFMDHHLHQGNSLIGARLEDLVEVLAGVASTRPSRRERKAREAGQLSMLDDPAFSQHVTAATDLLAQISARVVERAEDVKAQEADYKQVRAELEPYRRLADLWTARHYGVDVDGRQLRAISEYLLNGAVSPVPEYERLLGHTQELVDKWTIFHWKLEFPVPMLLSNGFDAVFGNPPWISFGLRGLGTLDEAEETFYRTRYTDSAEYKLSLYAVFIEAAMRLVQAGGRQSFIVPDSFLLGSYFSGIRRFILANSTIEQIILFLEDFWPSGSVGRCVLYVVRIEPDATARQQAMVEAIEAKSLGDFGRGIVRRNGYAQANFVQAHLNRFRLLFDESSQHIIEEMESGSRPLSKTVKFYSGLIGKAGKASIVIDTRPADYSPERCGRLISSGRYLGRYSLEFSGQYVRRERDLYKSGYDEDKYSSPKLFLNQTGDSLKVCYDDQGFFCLNNMHIGYPVAFDYDLRFVNAILCSRLMNFYYHTISLELGRAMAQIDIETVDRLPIPRVVPGSQIGKPPTLSESALELYYQYLSDPRHEHLALACQVMSEPFAHDSLVYLTQRMIDLNKEHQRLEREADLFRFVERDTPCLRLDKALGSPLATGEMASDLSAVRHDIEGLRLSQEEDGRWLLEVRAKLRDPEGGWREHQRDQDGNLVRQWLPVYRLPLDEATGRFYHYAFAHLRGFDGAGKFPGGYTRTALEKLQATKVPKFVPVDLAPLVALEAELADVRRKIWLTDDLIDQIVYKLYGLTEEEIAIVEERT
jgi:hypothetical protein